MEPVAPTPPPTHLADPVLGGNDRQSVHVTARFLLSGNALSITGAIADRNAFRAGALVRSSAADVAPGAW
jgi:hypothetical protein